MQRKKGFLPEWYCLFPFVIVCVWLTLEGFYRGCFIWLTPMQEEVSLLHYAAWLIDTQGYIPYKDVFETAFPGSLLFHLAIGHFLGYGDTAFHLFDFFWLAILMLITWLILRIFSQSVAWVGAIGFAAVYLCLGGAMTLQRDYVGILPIALALLFVCCDSVPVIWRSAGAGFLFGIAASMKPHLVIGLPVIAYLLLFPAEGMPVGKQHWRQKSICTGLAGILLGAGLPVLWVSATGGFSAWVGMVTEYLPVYMGDDGIRTTLWYMLKATWLEGWINRNIPVDLGGANPKTAGFAWQTANITGHLLYWLEWVLIAGLGVARGLRQTEPDSRQRQRVVAILVLFLLYWIYPVLANKYWNYHWMPFRYFGVLCASLLLLPARNKGPLSKWGTVFSFTVFILFMNRQLPPPNDLTVQEMLREWQGSGFQRNKTLADDIADFLRAHLHPGDLVQPLDEGGSAMRAMLTSKALLATPYLTYRQLLVNDMNPQVKAMREHFLVKMQQNPPRFIIDTHTAPETTFGGELYTFEELDQILNVSYRKIVDICNDSRCILTIWELNPG
jgi:hypothetical protein